MFHDDEVMVIRILDSVDGDDIRMGQARCGLCLPQESGPCLRTLLQAGWQELDCDLTVELGVVGEVYLAHAPLPQLGADAIMEYLLALHGRHFPWTQALTTCDLRTEV